MEPKGQRHPKGAHKQKANDNETAVYHYKTDRGTILSINLVAERLALRRCRQPPRDDDRENKNHHAHQARGGRG